MEFKARENGEPKQGIPKTGVITQGVSTAKAIEIVIVLLHGSSKLSNLVEMGQLVAATARRGRVMEHHYEMSASRWGAAG